MIHRVPITQEGALKKLVKSLHDKKGRQEHGLFLVEGKVSVSEFLRTDYTIQTLVVTEAYLELLRDEQLMMLVETRMIPVMITTPEILTRIGTLATNDHALAIVEQKNKDSDMFDLKNPMIVLDHVNDPGNLGTIIRIADWYGIRHIICSPDTVDVYNPKVVSATKGSLARVHVSYRSLESLFKEYPTVPVIGADLHGESLHTFSFPEVGFLLMGSESHGIHPDLTQYITERITIPRYGHAESLNVGVATAVIMDTWKRGISRS